MKVFKSLERFYADTCLPGGHVAAERASEIPIPPHRAVQFNGRAGRQPNEKWAVRSLARSEMKALAIYAIARMGEAQ